MQWGVSPLRLVLAEGQAMGSIPFALHKAKGILPIAWLQSFLRKPKALSPNCEADFLRLACVRMGYIPYGVIQRKGRRNGLRREQWRATLCPRRKSGYARSATGPGGQSTSSTSPGTTGKPTNEPAANSAPASCKTKRGVYSSNPNDFELSLCAAACTRSCARV